MYDIHNHILPGVDDGPKDWDSAIDMLRLAVKDGIKGIVATPHMMPGRYECKKENLERMMEELRIRAGQLPIKLFLGSEIMLSADTVLRIKGAEYLTINSSRYVLIELPGDFSKKNVMDLIFSLTSGGLVPIVAHPERNPGIQSDIDTLYELVRMGAIGQLNAGSLTGHFGPEIRKLALKMLSRRLVHVMSTDAHSDRGRTPMLSKGVEEVEKILGKSGAVSMVIDLPGKIINDEAIVTDEPVHVIKKFFSISG